VTGSNGSQPKQLRRGYVDGVSGQIHYREAGSGDPIICFHSTPRSSTFYSRVLPYLAKQYRAIAMDTPGFGMSDPLPGPPGPTMKPYYEAAVSFMDELGIEQASLVGHSTGCGIAFGIAGNYPNRVKNLIIAGFTGCETQADVDELYPILHSGISKTWGNPVDLDPRGEFLQEFPLEALRSLISPTGDTEYFILDLISHLQALPNYYWPFEAVLATPGPFAYTDTITAPILFVNATSGIATGIVKRAHERFRGSHYAEIDGTSIYPMSKPKEFAEIITSFIEQNADAPVPVGA
jgi:pimeloyl-ACP methyl ester carboxylesterase